jgi:hypothetical protein
MHGRLCQCNGTDLSGAGAHSHAAALAQWAVLIGEHWMGLDGICPAALRLAEPRAPDQSHYRGLEGCDHPNAAISRRARSAAGAAGTRARRRLSRGSDREGKRELLQSAEDDRSDHTCTRICGDLSLRSTAEPTDRPRENPEQVQA